MLWTTPTHLLLAACLMATAPARGQVGQVHETQTAGGMRIWDFPDNGADRFWLAVVVGVGARDEKPRQAGIAHLLEHVLFLSAGDRPDAAADAELEARGIEYNGYTGHEQTVFHVSGQARDWRFMVEWLADHVVRPRMLPEQFDGERRIVLEEIAMRGGPADAASVTFEGLLYGDRHPLAQSVGGSVTTVESISLDDVRAFHRRHYCAANLNVGFAGDVPRDECMQKVSAAFAALPQGARPEAAAPELHTGDLLPPGVRFGAGGGALRTGFHLSLDTAADLAKAMVLNDYLNERMFQRARSEEHLSYAPSVALVRYRDVQRVEFVSQTRQRHNIRTLAAIVDQLVAEVQDAPDVGLLRAKADLGAHWVVESISSLVSAATLASWIAWHGGDVDAFDSAALLLTPADLQAAARAWFVPASRYSISDVALAERSPPWILLGLLGGALGYSLFRYRQPVAEHLGGWVRPLRRRRRGEVLPLARKPVPPVDADELEREFHRYFEEEDRSRGER